MYVKLKVYLTLFGEQQSSVSKDQAANLRTGYVVYAPTLVYRPSQASMMDESGAMVKG